MSGISINGTAFRKLPANERREVWEQFLTEEEVAFMASSDEQFALADLLVENAVGVVPVPLGLASGFVIDGKQYLIPMAVEEPSVIAAAGFGAHIIAAGGGFVTSSSDPLLESYIYLERTRPEALERIRAGIPPLSEKLVPVLQGLTRRGGGLRAIEVQELKETRLIAVKLSIDVRDAMGANIVNTAAEALRAPLEELSGGRVLMCILSNASPERLARAEFSLPLAELSRFIPGFNAGDTARRIALACALANEDPARAVTHNKGIMNGIASLALATMNDTRALEGAVHAWSARDGRIRSLSTFITDGTTLAGALELPLAFGVVGGSTDIHPSAKAALRLLGNPGSMELARIAAALGLAQNFSALLALVTRGIQSGHMKYHAARVAYKAGARGSETRVIAEELALQKDYSISAAERALEELRQKGGKA